jgi:branched-chain amino acid transport system substrate-binding protein
MCLEASYFQVNVFARTLEQTNSMDTEILRASVMGSEFSAPQGEVVINPTWGHADLWTRIGRANRQGQFDLIYESPSCVSSDPYLLGYGRKLKQKSFEFA